MTGTWAEVPMPWRLVCDGEFVLPAPEADDCALVLERRRWSKGNLRVSLQHRDRSETTMVAGPDDRVTVLVPDHEVDAVELVMDELGGVVLDRFTGPRAPTERRART